LGRCKLCNTTSKDISSGLGVCLSCIREKPLEALKITYEVHTESRQRFNLPPSPPRSSEGILCGVCENNCKLAEGEKGYCGLVTNKNGKISRMGGTEDKGILEWYYDPIPTNCVAAWCCAGCTGSGYPKYSYAKNGEAGYYNLAVFYGSCSFDCLFCQNWHYRENAKKLKPVVSAEDLASHVTDRVSCICYFGGDPSSQILHAIKTSETALEKAVKTNRILRICWETNGYINRNLIEKVVQLSLKSGGTIKFDLKAMDENLNLALCGVSNKPTLSNFRRIGEKFNERLVPPLLVASTLLIPGYIDAKEVKSIAKFIAEVNPEIPYSLLAFYPNYVLNDLPTTSFEQAHDCLKVAKDSGLKNVRLGNIHLLH